MRPEDQRPTTARDTARPDYTVVPRTLLFLTRDEEVLLLRGAPDKKLWAGKYNGVGGHIEPGESPYQSALRELREETGLSGVRLVLRAIVHITLPEAPGVMLFVFTGEVGAGAAGVRPSLEGTPEWVPLAKLASLPLVEDLPQLLPRVLAGGPPFFARYAFTEQGLQMTFDEEYLERSL